MIIAVVEFANKAVFPAVENRPFHIKKFTGRNIHIILYRDLVGVDHDEIVINGSFCVLAAEIEVSMVRRCKDRILICLSAVENKECLIFEPAVKDLCIKVAGKSRRTVRAYITEKKSFAVASGNTGDP